MVRTSKEKLIKAKDVLTCGPPSMLVMETALITLAHLALYSEEIENEVGGLLFFSYRYLLPKDLVSLELYITNGYMLQMVFSDYNFYFVHYLYF